MFAFVFAVLAVPAVLSLATPTRRATAIEVVLHAPAYVDSIDDIKLTAAVTNTGSEELKILKYGTILDNKLPTRSFKVSKDGQVAKFTGIRLQLSLDELDDAAVVVIPAGETVTVDHDVAALYDFESLGTGAFEFEAVTTFQILDAAAKPGAVTVSASNAKVDVKSDVKMRKLSSHGKRSVVTCSDSTLSSFISASYPEGKSLAALAANYVAANGADALVTAYFGTGSLTTVYDVLANVATENSTTRTLNCDDPYGGCSSGVIAYTVVSTSDIYFCSPFFTEVSTPHLCTDTTVADRDIRGGTVLHELTHATSGTEDFSYGCDNDQALALSDPGSAVLNADTYNCFATQVYKNTQCH